MRKIKKLEPVKRSREGIPITFYLKESLRDAIKVLGSGYVSKGLNNILTTYEDEILNAAAKAKTKKAS